MTALSVLDQGPVTAERGPATVLHDAVTLAQHVEDLGFTRYWVAEHHATPSVGISAPEIAIAHLAAATSRLRIGAGGMMLPNHSPLHLAEQFRTLEALHPGRIDLGIGRSHGTTHEPTVTALARADLGADTFTTHLRELLAAGSAQRRPDNDTPLVIPENVPLPPVFVLGSSASSARLAGRLGLGYAFLAAYQDPAIAIETLRAYRDHYTPAAVGTQPHAILTLTVIVGTDDDHADRLAGPWRLALAHHALGQGQPLHGLDQLRTRTAIPDETDIQNRAPLNDRRTEIVGNPARVADTLHELIDKSQADEILAVTNIPDLTERLRSYDRLATAVRP